MKTKKMTINKDGSHRKTGSGRKKGSNSFVKVSFSQLKDYIGERTPMMVSRVWLESLGFIVGSEDVSVKIIAKKKDEKQEIVFSIKDFSNE